MHPNPSFRAWPEAEARAFVSARSFGVLTLAGAEEPLAAHIPFRLSEDGARAEFHLVRSNPIARALREGEVAALLVVSGPDAYVSPDWYDIGPDQVPTWNYQAVHLRGAARLLPEAALRPHLERLSAHFEERLAPKPAWTLEKTSPGFIERLARGIVPGELDIATLESTLKLNQNKPDDARRRAADAIARSAIGSAPATRIAGLMRDRDAKEPSNDA